MQESWTGEEWNVIDQTDCENMSFVEVRTGPTLAEVVAIDDLGVAITAGLTVVNGVTIGVSHAAVQGAEVPAESDLHGVIA